MLPADLQALVALFDENRNMGLEKILGLARAHEFSEEALHALGVHDKKLFRQMITRVYRAYSASRYAGERLTQMMEAGFSLWVYRSGDCSHHRELDGLALPPDHPFWLTYAPPNCPECGCYVIGARHEAGARRLGATSFGLDPDTSSSIRIHPDFKSRPPISAPVLINAVINGG